MKQSNLAYLNRLLVDYLGRTPAGGPLYKWFYSRDPEMFVRIGQARIPMVDELRWTLGMWQRPEPKPIFAMKYGNDVPYPRAGYYVPCRIPSEPLLLIGVEPNERITMYTIETIRDLQALGGDGVSQVRRDSRAKRKAHNESEADAMLSQMWRNYNPKVPGAKEQLGAV